MTQFAYLELVEDKRLQFPLNFVRGGLPFLFFIHDLFRSCLQINFDLLNFALMSFDWRRGNNMNSIHETFNRGK
jgi:hypothetical protein